MIDQEVRFERALNGLMRGDSSKRDYRVRVHSSDRALVRCAFLAETPERLADASYYDASPFKFEEFSWFIVDEIEPNYLYRDFVLEFTGVDVRSCTKVELQHLFGTSLALKAAILFLYFKIKNINADDFEDACAIVADIAGCQSSYLVKEYVAYTKKVKGV